LSEKTGQENTPSKAGLHPDEDGFRQTLGATLAKAREEKGISIAKASSDLRLNKDYLRALESGDWSELPGRFYVRGFLRQYADYLEVDIRPELDALRTRDYRLTRPHTIPDPPIAPARKWAIAAGIAFVLLFLFFNILESRHEVESPVTVDEQPLAETEKQIAVGESMLATVNDRPDQTVLSERQPPSEPPPSEPARLQQDPSPSTQEEAPPETEKTTPPPGKTVDQQEQQTPASPAGHRYTFEAHEMQVWLRVFDENRKRLKTFLLEPGESATVEYDGSAVYVTTGRAGALQISVDGKVVAAAGSLGAPGEVLRMVKVEAGSRRISKGAGDPPRPQSPSVSTPEKEGSERIRSLNER